MLIVVQEPLTLYPYQVEQDCYCYKGTDVLKNRAGIKDAALLEQFELEMTTLRAEEPLPQGKFDVRHYRSVHHHIFQDVYTWAGKFRTVRTGKGGNWFCYPENIDAALVPVFVLLQAPAFLPGADAGSFVAAAAHFLGELNAVHPFREGNGRSQLAFLDLVGDRAGHPFVLEQIQRQSFMPAMIASFAGELGLLEAELNSLLA